MATLESYLQALQMKAFHYDLSDMDDKDKEWLKNFNITTVDQLKSEIDKIGKEICDNKAAMSVNMVQGRNPNLTEEERKDLDDSYSVLFMNDKDLCNKYIILAKIQMSTDDALKILHMDKSELREEIEKSHEKYEN